MGFGFEREEVGRERERGRGSERGSGSERGGGRRRREEKHVPSLSLVRFTLSSYLFLGLLLGHLDGLEPALELAVVLCGKNERERVGEKGGGRKEEEKERAFQSIDNRSSLISFRENRAFELPSALYSRALWPSAAHVKQHTSSSTRQAAHAAKENRSKEKVQTLRECLFFVHSTSTTTTAAKQSPEKNENDARLAHLFALFVDRVLGPLFGEDVGRVGSSGSSSRGAVLRHGEDVCW